MERRVARCGSERGRRSAAQAIARGDRYCLNSLEVGASYAGICAKTSAWEHAPGGLTADGADCAAIVSALETRLAEAIEMQKAVRAVPSKLCGAGARVIQDQSKARGGRAGASDGAGLFRGACVLEESSTA